MTTNELPPDASLVSVLQLPYDMGKEGGGGGWVGGGVADSHCRLLDNTHLVTSVGSYPPCDKCWFIPTL